MRSRRDSARSRREFLKLVAAGSAAALVSAAPAASAIAAEKPAPREGKHARSAALRKEIGDQEQYLARALKVIREYSLPPGSDMAFVFKPMKASSARRANARAERSK